MRTGEVGKRCIDNVISIQHPGTVQRLVGQKSEHILGPGGTDRRNSIRYIQEPRRLRGHSTSGYNSPRNPKGPTYSSSSILLPFNTVPPPTFPKTHPPYPPPPNITPPLCPPPAATPCPSPAESAPRPTKLPASFLTLRLSARQLVPIATRAHAISRLRHRACRRGGRWRGGRRGCWREGCVGGGL